MEQMSPVSVLENESRLMEGISGRISQQAQLPKDVLTSGCLEYRATCTGQLSLPLPAAAASSSSSSAAAALVEEQNPFSVIGSVITADVQVILQSVQHGVQRCQVGADSSFVLLTHNSQGHRLTTGGHAELFQVSYILLVSTLVLL